MGCWGDECLVFGGNVTFATPPTSAAEVAAAAVAAAAANADGLDKQVGDMMMAMHLYGEGKVPYYCESRLRENCESDGGSLFTNKWGSQLYFKFLSVCCEIGVHKLCSISKQFRAIDLDRRSEIEHIYCRME